MGKVKDKTPKKINPKSWLFKCSIVLWVIQLLPCTGCLWNCLKRLIVSIVFEDELSNIAQLLSNNKDFFGTAIWTLTTVLSAFLVSFYNQQQQRHYGVSQRRIIAYDAGTHLIPICIIVNIGVVLLMTRDYYSTGIAAFYFRALSSIILQLILISYCIYITSHDHSLKVIKEVEILRFKDQIEKDTAKEYKRGETPYLFIIPLILDGEEADYEKYDALKDMLSDSLKKIHSEALIPYLIDNFRVISEWMTKNDTNQQYLYGLVSGLLNNASNWESKSIATLSLDKSEVIISCMILATGSNDRHFSSLWDVVTNMIKNEEKEAFSLLRVTLEFMINRLGYGREGLSPITAEKIRRVFIDKESDIASRESQYCEWLNMLFPTGDSEEDIQKDVNVIINRVKSEPVPDVKGAVHSSMITRILD